MKTISLDKAFSLLESASAVVIDNVVTYPELDTLTGEAGNQFLRLSWDDGEHEFEVRFCEGGNALVKVQGSSLWLVDDEGDEAQITILIPAENLENA